MNIIIIITGSKLKATKMIQAMYVYRNIEMRPSFVVVGKLYVLSVCYPA